MSEPAFEGFPSFVQVCLPAPAADVIQRALRMAHDVLVEEEANLLLKDDYGDDEKLVVAQSTKIRGQFDLLAEFFDDVAINPQGYPVRGGMAASIKRRQRQWTATQPKKPRRKKGQTRRAYEARVARWSVKRQEEVAAYNKAANELIIADLPVTQTLVDALLGGTTIEEIQSEIEKQQREYDEQEKKIADMVAAIQADDDQPGSTIPYPQDDEEPPNLDLLAVTGRAKEESYAESGIILPAGVDGG